jgi:hypothetical protein
MSETVKKFDPSVFGPDLSCDPFTQVLRVFTYFLESLFEHEEFRGSGLFWNKDEAVTEMLISAEKPRLEALEKTPHITVVLGASQWGNLGHDQMQTRKMAEEDRTHTDLVSSTVSFHCQGKEGLHCRRMAWYASQYTTIFRRMLMRQGGLHQVGSNHSISAESGPTAFLGKLTNEELVSVVVTVPFYWQPQWRIREPRALLNKIETNLRVRGFVATPFRVKGRPAHSIPIDQYGSFEELEDAVQGEAPALTQVVLSSEG